MIKLTSMTMGLLMLIVLSVAPARAGVPLTINYQGVLTDSAGVPITNASQSMTFSLYDAATGGTQYWTETQTVNVQNGTYAVQLGTVTPLYVGQFVYYELWLEVSVGGEVLAGRQKLDSVPYALVASTADSVEGYTANQLNQSAHLTDTANPHNVTAAQIGAATATGLSTHAGDTANPHGVTAVQVGAVARSGDSMTGKLTINDATAGPILTGSGGGLSVSGTGPVYNAGAGGYDPGAVGAIPTTGAGTRMMWYPEKAAFRTGEVTANDWDDNNTGFYSFAAGKDALAKGNFSISMGLSNSVTGDSSIAIGLHNLVTTTGSFAVGSDNLIQNASAGYSLVLGARNETLSDSTIAIGTDNKVGGAGSITLGRNLATTIYGVTALGLYNAYTPTPVSNIYNWTGTDPLFVIGNGTSETNRSNALVMLKNGNTIINGTLTANAFVGDGSGLTNLSRSALGDISGDLRFSAGSNHSLSLLDDTKSLFIGGGTTSPWSVWLQGTNYVAIKTNGLERFRVTGNGNVGIGTSSPSASLDIAGTVRIGSNGTVIRGMQSGSSVLGPNTTGGKKTFSISFPNTFSQPPSVTVTVRNSGTYTDVFTASTTNVTTTGFQVTLFRVDASGATWGQSPNLDWLAVAQ